MRRSHALLHSSRWLHPGGGSSRDDHAPMSGCPGSPFGFPLRVTRLALVHLGMRGGQCPGVRALLVPGTLERTGTTPAPGPGRSVLSVVLAGGLLLSPIIASGVGFVGGAAAGLFLAARATRLRSNKRLERIGFPGRSAIR